MGLSQKQQVFVEAYLRCWNAAEAARQAGYSERSARSIGAENLTKPDIQAAIAARLDELKQSADEVLVGVSDIARNSHMGHFIRIDEAGDPFFDFSQAEDKLHYVKKLTRTTRRIGNLTEVQTSIELHDMMAARALMGKHHKLFTDRLEVVDWRKEMEKAGLDPDAEAERLAAEYAANLRTRARGADAGSLDAGEGSGSDGT